ncbi:LysR substrate-binding domain-containing protein [Paeniglutamicibacter sp. ZC-3]|uniref:LysR substrate-binding domain-containing protein n=1 Tax=Paeniglutamicibacter sp. ZC-3 TaxID=2986919 RepID=UPI0021F6C94A|nr:LysR substrate-binding domain-containing protein [Paeniglutamicibacter sp. ZC-3]MCV9994897.1 LysR substrate-binding domain-containing protein [Paeniglutamicibacter sp. ZC-3]
MLEIRRLRLLRELSIRGTIAEVSDALSYSPSSISQQLSLLEKETGVKLLRKVGRRLQLTPQAEVLVAHTDELLDSMERAEGDLASTQQAVAGTVRLAVFQTAVLSLIPSVLRELRQDFPHLRVEMVQHEPETALHETWARDFDLVVAEQYPGHAAPHYATLDRKILAHDAIRLALPARDEAMPAEFHHVTAIEAAAGLPWVMEPRGAASRHWAEQACRMAGFEPDVRYETADLQAHVRLVESGNAVALLPDLVWAARKRDLRIVDLPGAPQRTIFTSVRHSSTQHPGLVAVRNALHAQAAALPAPTDVDPEAVS